MSLERLKKYGISHYLYSCNDEGDITITGDNRAGYPINNLSSYVTNEHNIVDERVIRAMKNKAQCYKTFNLKNSWTFGIYMANELSSRLKIFGKRNNATTYLHEKWAERYTKNRMYSTWYDSLSNNIIEISNVDKEFYEKGIKELIKEVS